MVVDRSEATLTRDRETSVKYRDMFYKTEHELRKFFPELIEFDQEIIEKAQLVIDQGYLCIEDVENCDINLLDELYTDFKLIYDERKDNLNSKQRSYISLDTMVDEIHIFYENPKKEIRDIVTRTVNWANKENIFD